MAPDPEHSYILLASVLSVLIQDIALATSPRFEDTDISLRAESVKQFRTVWFHHNATFTNQSHASKWAAVSPLDPFEPSPSSEL